MSEKPCGAYFFAFFEKFVAPILTSGGYVGLSIATLLSQHHKVMAVDIVPEKVELINSKKSPIQDEYIMAIVTGVIASGLVSLALEMCNNYRHNRKRCVDIEYNREGVEIKRRHRGDRKGWIAPDILLHRRTSVDKDNIFCCEVKQNEDEFNNDSDRVKDAVRERHYLFGVNLYSIQPEAAKLSVFIRKDGFVRESVLDSSFHR